MSTRRQLTSKSQVFLAQTAGVASSSRSGFQIDILTSHSPYREPAIPRAYVARLCSRHANAHQLTRHLRPHLGTRTGQKNGGRANERVIGRARRRLTEMTEPTDFHRTFLYSFFMGTFVEIGLFGQVGQVFRRVRRCCGWGRWHSPPTHTWIPTSIPTATRVPATPWRGRGTSTGGCRGLHNAAGKP